MRLLLAAGGSTEKRRDKDGKQLGAGACGTAAGTSPAACTDRLRRPHLFQGAAFTSSLAFRFYQRSRCLVRDRCRNGISSLHRSLQRRHPAVSPRHADTRRQRRAAAEYSSMGQNTSSGGGGRHTCSTMRLEQRQPLQVLHCNPTCNRRKTDIARLSRNTFAHYHKSSDTSSSCNNP